MIRAHNARVAADRVAAGRNRRQQGSAGKRRQQQRRKSTIRKIKNFTVIPINSFQRQHIRIDNQALFHIVKRAQVVHASIRRGAGAQSPMKPNANVMTNANYTQLWRYLFKIDELERKKGQRYKFHKYVQTDGVALSFCFERTQRQEIVPKTAEEHKAKAKSKFLEADQVIAIDVGERLTIGGIRRCKAPGSDGGNNDGSSETNIRLSSSQFHHQTNARRRKRFRARMTRLIDDEMRADRERYARDQQQKDWIGPHSANYEAYAKHILKFFNRAIAAYTVYEYALQNFLQYIDTNRAIARMARQLIDGKRKTFFIIGDKFTASNSPIRGYVRTKVRALFLYLSRLHSRCFVYYTDEFRTTKLCSMCFHSLAQPIKRINRGQPDVEYRQVKKKYRYYLCRGCKKDHRAIEAQHHVDSRKNNKQLTRQRRQIAIDILEGNDNNVHCTSSTAIEIPSLS